MAVAAPGRCSRHECIECLNPSSKMKGGRSPCFFLCCACETDAGHAAGDNSDTSTGCDACVCLCTQQLLNYITVRRVAVKWIPG
eukprot:986251-Amphidinium_carterae.1